MMVEITPEMGQRVRQLLLSLAGFQREKENLERTAEKIDTANTENKPEEKQKAMFLHRAIEMKTREMEQMYFWGWIDGQKNR
jgi:hypothetical protein